jgi:hypothetical protein
MKVPKGKAEAKEECRWPTMCRNINWFVRRAIVVGVSVWPIVSVPHPPSPTLRTFHRQAPLATTIFTESFHESQSKTERQCQ